MSSEYSNYERTILLDGETLRLEQVVDVARNFSRAELAPEAKARMAASRKFVEQVINEGQKVYGITTGFGALHDRFISTDQAEQLQENIILSHSAGVGDPLPEETVRAMMALRANALAKGYSGIRVEIAEQLLDILNKRICPIIPAKGSVGSSGDLAPLAHMALVMLGRGEAVYEGQRLPGAEALKRAGIQPVKLKAKEGLALTNGTQTMTAIGVLALHDGENLAKVADIAGAMSLEAMKGKSCPFLDQVQKLRPFSGQAGCAANIRRLIEGSQLIDRIDTDTEGETQDAYSLRCIPQVHGASREAIAFTRRMLEIEINSATDNPLIFADRSIVCSAGNFHGQPIALAMDFLALALAELGSISERRVARLMDENHNRGLPAFLTESNGLNSGLMLAQYTAASLVSENKVLIHPASGDSIPTSANQEDHNSMGTIAARQAQQVLENVERILAIELLCAAQALGLRRQRPGVGTAAAYNLIRSQVPQLEKDREIYRDIQTAVDLVRGGRIVREVERTVGQLQ